MCVHAGIHVRKFLFMHVWLHVNFISQRSWQLGHCMYIYIYICMYVCMYIDTHACIHAFVSTDNFPFYSEMRDSGSHESSRSASGESALCIYIHTHTSTHTNTCIHTFYILIFFDFFQKCVTREATKALGLPLGKHALHGCRNFQMRCQGICM